MMKRKFFSTIAAVAALSFVTGLLGCSDDDDKGPNYGSCEGLAAAEDECEEADDFVKCVGDTDFCKGLDVQSELSSVTGWDALPGYSKCVAIVEYASGEPCDD
jgi:hypothetical protein